MYVIIIVFIIPICLSLFYVDTSIIFDRTLLWIYILIFEKQQKAIYNGIQNTLKIHKSANCIPIEIAPNILAR